MREIQEYVSCDCGCGVLRFWAMPDDDDDPHFVYVSLLGEGGSQCWRYRLRYIWHILRTGDPYTDEVVLDREAVERLRHFCDVALDNPLVVRPWIERRRSGEVS